MDSRDEYIRLLQRRLPEMGFCWPGFRKVSKQVIRRMGRRVEELGLDGPLAYEEYLLGHPEEVPRMEEMLRITISCFWRDRSLWETLGDKLLPGMAREASERGADALRSLSAGCCSGEEPYTLRILWDLQVLPGLEHKLPLRITALDSSPEMLVRARKALYTYSSTRHLPPALRERAFTRARDMYQLRQEFREGVEFMRHDLRETPAAGPFDIILCRNLVLTYFSGELQAEVISGLIGIMRPGGALVTGVHESLPEGIMEMGMASWEGHKCVYLKSPGNKQGQSPLIEPP
jgi:chemotaxis protein methyltransferase CheR